MKKLTKKVVKLTGKTASLLIKFTSTVVIGPLAVANLHILEHHLIQQQIQLKALMAYKKKLSKSELQSTK